MMGKNTERRLVTMFIPLYRVINDPDQFDTGMAYKTRDEAEASAIKERLIRVVPITHSI